MKSRNIERRFAKMKKLLIAAVAVLAMVNAVQADEIPASFVNQDWCLADGSDWAFIPVKGCKSLVIKRDALIWNLKNRQESCSINSIEGNSEWLRIRGSCQAKDESFHALDVAFSEKDDGCSPYGQRCLLLITKPGLAVPGAVAPKTVPGR